MIVAERKPLEQIDAMIEGFSKGVGRRRWSCWPPSCG